MHQLITMIITILLLLTSLSFADECKSEPSGITIHFYSKGNEWSLSWEIDGFQKKKAAFNENRKDGYRTNIYAGLSDKRSDNLPQTLLTPDKRFDVPFDISKNEELLVAAIYKKSDILWPTKQAAVVDLREKKIVRIVESEFRIESLAWAPDSNYFAVLYRQDVTDQVFKGPIDWLAELLGHGNYYWTFYLTIYKPDGTSVCTEQVAKKLPNAMTYMDWDNH